MLSTQTDIEARDRREAEFRTNYGRELRESTYYVEHGLQRDADAIAAFCVSRAGYKSGRYESLKGQAYDGGYRLAAYFGVERATSLIDLARLYGYVRTDASFRVKTRDGFDIGGRKMLLLQAVTLRQSCPGARVARSR